MVGVEEDEGLAKLALIAQGVDAICVVPVDPSALEPVLGEALSKGIVVIDHEGASQQNCLYDIEAFSNEGLGQTIMKELAKMMGEKGVYTTMVGNVTNASHNEWADAVSPTRRRITPA